MKFLVYDNSTGRFYRRKGNGRNVYFTGKFNMAEEVEFWFDVLLNKVMSVFNVTCEDKRFNVVDFKLQLILNGMTFITRYKGKTTPFSCSPAKNSDTSYTEFDKINWHCPTYAKTVPVEDGVIVRNTALYMSLYRLIEHYAVLLAHADITVMKSFINVRRETGGIVADDEETVKSVNRYLNETFNGVDTAITTTMIGTVKPLYEGTVSSPRDIIEARENIMNAFLTEIGVKSSKTKKGNMQTAEVEADNAKILVSVSDMLNWWKKGAEEIKDKFGITLNIELNPDIMISDFVDETGGSDSDVRRDVSKDGGRISQNKSGDSGKSDVSDATGMDG